MKVSFNGFNNKALTFLTDEELEQGDLVTLDGEGKLVPAEQGDVFIGVVESCRGGYASVTVSGALTVPADTSVQPGYQGLSMGSNGVVTAGDELFCKFVLSVDTYAGTAVILM